MPIIHPSKRAAEWALALRSDPIAAQQIKEHLPPGELARLFGLPSERDLADSRDELGDAEARIDELEKEIKALKDEIAGL